MGLEGDSIPFGVSFLFSRVITGHQPKLHALLLGKSLKICHTFAACLIPKKKIGSHLMTPVLSGKWPAWQARKPKKNKGCTPRKINRWTLRIHPFRKEHHLPNHHSSSGV